MTWSTVARPRRRLGAALAVCLALTAVPSIVGSAAAADDVVLDRDAAMEQCNGVAPVPGSENTLKDIAPGSDLNPGGLVTFEVTYPNVGHETGDAFVLTDCFGVVDAKGDMVEELDKFQVTFVPNGNDFSFQYDLVIPDDVAVGTQVCNWIKTTAGPSKSPASARKGDVCFNVGGSLRVEKHDENGAPLYGAKFEVSCEDDPAVLPDVVISGLYASATSNATPVTTNPAVGYLNAVPGTTNAIAINGEEGATCTVEELEAPAGYLLPPLPADRVHEYQIPRGAAAATFAIVNEPVPPDYDAVVVSQSPAGTYDVPTTWALSKTATPAALSGTAGQSAGSTQWAVTADKTVGSPTNHTVTDRTIALSNPNPVAAAGTVTALVGGAPAPVDCDSGLPGAQTAVTVPAAVGGTPGTASCTWAGSPTSAMTVAATFTSTTPFVDGGSSSASLAWTAVSTGPQSLDVDDARETGSVFPAEDLTADTTLSFTEGFTCPTDQSLYTGGTHQYVVTNTATSSATPYASATVTVTCSLPGALTVAASPAGAHDVESSWTLSKSVDDSSHTGVAGGTAGTSTWTVEAVETQSAPTGHRLLAGSLTVSNPNAFPVTATLSAAVGAAAVALDCDPAASGTQSTGVSVPARASGVDGALTCTWAQTAAASGAAFSYTVTTSTPPVGGAAASLPVTYARTDTGPQTLTVDDDRAPAGVLPDTATETEEWSYDETFTCPTEAAGDYEDGVLVQQVVNTATAPGLPGASSTVTVTCTLPPVAGLTVVKSVQSSDAVVNPGDTLTYTLVVTAKEATEQDVVVSDVVPGRDPAEPGSGDTTYVPGSAACEAPGPCTASYDAATGTVTWAIGDLAPGASRRVSFAVTIDGAAAGPAVADVVNRGVARSDETPSTLSNRVVTPVTVVLGVTPTPTPTPTPVVLPFVDTPRTLPFTGIEVLPVMAFGTLAALVGALLVGTARRREQE